MNSRSQKIYNYENIPKPHIPHARLNINKRTENEIDTKLRNYVVYSQM